MTTLHKNLTTHLFPKLILPWSAIQIITLHNVSNQNPMQSKNQKSAETAICQHQTQQNHKVDRSGFFSSS